MVIIEEPIEQTTHVKAFFVIRWVLKSTSPITRTDIRHIAET